MRNEWEEDIDTRHFLKDLKELEFVLRSWSVTERYNKDKFESAAFQVDRIIEKVEKENKK